MKQPDTNRGSTERIGAPRLWTVLARCHHALAAVTESSVSAMHLCLSDFMVLEVLLHKGPLTIGEIRSKVLLASGSMTAAVDRLEKRKLVARVFSAEDRRVRRVELTADGQRMAASAFRSHERDLENACAVLNLSERRTLHRLLKKLGLSAAASLGEAPLAAKGERER